MSWLEVKGLFQLPSGRFMPCGLNIWQRLWWRFVPGEVINVRWPVGDIIITDDNPRWDWTIGPPWYVVESTDPNDHYRPELTRLVGKQGWNWNWGMAHNDVAANRLTIKFRRKHAKWASYFALKWS
jgi:hypothetical protein